MSRRRRSARAEAAKLGFEYTKIGAAAFDLSDPYHLALTVRWPTFVVGAVGLYALIAALFAALYMARPDCVAGARPGMFADRVFFSIETLATVGYGEMYPANLYGHWVSCAEIICGIAFTAIFTGLIFVRFSRPRAKFVFSDQVVITRYSGRPALMIRIGNGRTSILSHTEVKVNALINEVTSEGARYRRVHELRLTRGAIPIFPLITTFMHLIDEESPLAGLDLARIHETDIRLLVSVEAHDPALAAKVQDLKSYGAADIKVGWRFVDAVTILDSGAVVADLTRVSHIEPDGRAVPASAEVLA